MNFFGTKNNISKIELIFVNNKHSYVLGLFWVLITISFIVIQLILRTEFSILLMATVALICCGIPIIFFGLFDLIGLFSFALLSKYSFFPFIIKTTFGERIDVGLHDPYNTFLVIMIGSLIVCLALIMAKIFPIKKHILNNWRSKKQLLFVGYIAVLLGFGFLLMHLQFKPKLLPGGKLSQGFGGFGQFVSLINFGIVALTAFAIKSNQKISKKHKIALIAKSSAKYPPIPAHGIH
jgi:hypothetical protein